MNYSKGKNKGNGKGKGKGKGKSSGPKSSGPVIGFASGSTKNPHSGKS